MEKWQAIAAERRRIRDAQIPPEWILKDLPDPSVTNVMHVPYTCGIMTPSELAITEKDATELIEQMSTGALQCVDVTLAFCKRAAIAQQLLNCLTDIFFDEALDRAKEVDAYFAKHGKPIGPLHGLPFSVKTHWDVKGKEASSCYVSQAYDVAEEDCPTVAILRAAGAVFFVKTTAPQALMHLETTSNLFGRTLNPFNRNLTPGGSSGGESALVGFHGSPMGLAADGGGSIRAPAANMGLIGLKATSDRIPLRGNRLFTAVGNSAFPAVGGPVCHSVRDQHLFMKTVLDTQPWILEPELVPLPWREVVLEKVTFGYFTFDGCAMPHPPIVQAINRLVDMLKAQPNVEVVAFEPFDHPRGYDIVRRLYFQDGGKSIYDTCAASGEPILELTQWILKPPQVQRYTLEETWLQHDARERYRREYQVYWEKKYSNVDFVICPVESQVAPKHDTAKNWSYTASDRLLNEVVHNSSLPHTQAVYNCLDWPACAFPTGWNVNPSEYSKTDHVPLENEFDAYNWSLWHPEDYKDAPISLQLVGRKWHCEEVLKGVDLLQKVLASSAAS